MHPLRREVALDRRGLPDKAANASHPLALAERVQPLRKLGRPVDLHVAAQPPSVWPTDLEALATQLHDEESRWRRDDCVDLDAPDASDQPGVKVAREYREDVTGRTRHGELPGGRSKSLPRHRAVDALDQLVLVVEICIELPT